MQWNRAYGCIIDKNNAHSQASKTIFYKSAWKLYNTPQKIIAQIRTIIEEIAIIKYRNDFLTCQSLFQY